MIIMKILELNVKDDEEKWILIIINDKFNIIINIKCMDEKRWKENYQIESIWKWTEQNSNRMDGMEQRINYY